MDERFVQDSISQLKKGNSYYVFFLRQAEEIQRILKEKTGIDCEIKHTKDDYYLLKPIKK